jgi:transposase
VSVLTKVLTAEKKSEQKEFLDASLNPKLAEAKAGQRVVLFADAVHFVCGSFLGYLWCAVRLFVPTMSGKMRYNVLGTIDAMTHDLLTACHETCINALIVCELLHKIRKKYQDKVVTILLDNAKYQKCKLVQELAHSLNIELLFLPSYSPNLNIIERLWKWTKKACLNCKYYETFTEIKEAINKSLQKTVNHENKEATDTLLTLNFQLYDSAAYNRV